MLKDLFDAIVRLVFGTNTVDNAADWKRSHDKASASRTEVQQIIKNAETNENKKG